MSGLSDRPRTPGSDEHPLVSALDHISALTRTLLHAPHAVIGVVDGDRTVFRSTVGLPGHELPRERSITALMVDRNLDELVIEDAHREPAFADHPYVTGEPYLRFFAGVLVHDAAGKPVGAIGAMDSTPRPRPAPQIMQGLRELAQLASAHLDQTRWLRDLNERMDIIRLTEKMAGVGHWRVDARTLRVTWSEEVYRIHGLSPDAFDPNYDDAVAFYHPEDRPIIVAAVGRALEAGDGYRLTLRIRRADGEERLVESHAELERDADGQPSALIGVFQDVTERERSRRVLADSEAAYRAIAERTCDIIAVFNMEGVFSYVSPAMRTVLGWSPDELIGTRTWALIHPDDHETVRASYREVIAAGPGGGRRMLLRYRGRRKDGGWAWLEAQPTVMWDDTGRPVQVQDNIRDVTETQALEAELVHAKEQAEAASRAKSDFLANMSHELRTPLTAVTGFAALLRASPDLSAQDRRHVDLIATASDSLLSVINDVLDYSKLEAGSVDIDPVAFDPHAMVAAAAAILKPQAEAKGLSLEVAVDADVPTTVMADESRLRQIVLNYLSNAVKFTGSGKVRLHVSWRDGRLRAEVSDSGIGIPEEKLEKLFARFVQADASTTRKFGGTGLGLAISRRLAELMGGTVGVQSEFGHGAAFWVEIAAPETEASVADDGSGDTDATLDLNILVADDAAPNRELISTILRGLGQRVQAVEDGAAAVEAVRSGDFDVVLMDVHMPVMDGLDATRIIRRLPGARGAVPIIALTASVGQQQIQQCLEAGMNAHVGKPIVVSGLVEALVDVTSPKPERGASAA